jgi:polyisoprenoid-binding protein YceI
MSPNSSDRYIIDTRVSQFTAQAFASGLISAVAHSPKIAIREWEGLIQMEPGTLANASLQVRIKANSLEVLDELPDRDRRELHRVMNQEVLETSLYPAISYESSSALVEKLKEDLYRVQLRGELNLHGISNPLLLVAQVAIGVDSARAHGEFVVRQSDYDIPIASIAGGTLKLLDELKLSFYVVARKATEESQNYRSAAF